MLHITVFASIIYELNLTPESSRKIVLLRYCTRHLLRLKILKYYLFFFQKSIIFSLGVVFI
jgi:hypothetical protein